MDELFKRLGSEYCVIDDYQSISNIYWSYYKNLMTGILTFASSGGLSTGFYSNSSISFSTVPVLSEQNGKMTIDGEEIITRADLNKLKQDIDNLRKALIDSGRITE